MLWLELVSESRNQSLINFKCDNKFTGDIRINLKSIVKIHEGSQWMTQ